MRCLMCEELSFSHICSSCQKENLQPSFYQRDLPLNIPVYSFYKYKDIKNLLHTKHTDLGYYIFKILAKLSFSKFAEKFVFRGELVSLGIDDHVRHGYSHTGLLNSSLRSYHIKPLFAKLRAQNEETFSGKSYGERVQNPRDFKVERFKSGDVILVDDIITTGLTFMEAISALESEGKNVVFCLALADVRQETTKDAHTDLNFEDAYQQ